MKQRQTIGNNKFGLKWWAALVLVVAFIPATKLLAQGEGAERELEAARQQIHEMLREAEKLQKAGKPDAADHMRQEAHKMANRIEEHQAQRRRGQGEREQGERGHGEREQAAKHLHNVLEGLERGMEALRAIDRNEELQALERVAQGVRRRLEGLQEGRDRPQRERRRERRGEGNEREMAMHQLEIMRLAMPALREGERRDAADLLEHAIHARELALEGVRNEKAQKVRESAPNRAQLAEILGLSSRLWREFGNKERAQAVGKLAEQLSARVRRERGERAQREQDRPRREAREQDRPRREAREHREHDGERHDEREKHDQSDRYQAAMERIERLEGQIKRLGAALERMQGQLHGRDREHEHERR